MSVLFTHSNRAACSYWFIGLLAFISSQVKFQANQIQRMWLEQSHDEGGTLQTDLWYLLKSSSCDVL